MRSAEPYLGIYATLAALKDTMLYDDSDLDDPPMDSISFQDKYSLHATRSSRSLYTPVIVDSAWNEDMLPVHIHLDPESHLEIPSVLQVLEVSATPLVMIDSGATAEFTNSQFIEKLGLTTRKKSHARPLYTIEGSKIKGGSVKYKVDVRLRAVRECAGCSRIHSHPWVKAWEYPPMNSVGGCGCRLGIRHNSSASVSNW